MKNEIYYWLTKLRDKDCIPQIIIDFIDWLRYVIFW